MLRIRLPKHTSDRSFCSESRRSDICLEGREREPVFSLASRLTGSKARATESEGTPSFGDTEFSTPQPRGVVGGRLRRSETQGLETNPARRKNVRGNRPTFQLQSGHPRLRRAWTPFIIPSQSLLQRCIRPEPIALDRFSADVGKSVERKHQQVDPGQEPPPSSQN